MAKRTALYSEHARLGGRLIDFGGWELPVQYSGVMDEHLTCRKSAGLFDVSHMGEILVEGPGAERFLNFLVTNNVAKLHVQQAQYTAMCRQDGGIVDDLVIYRRAQDRFLVVVNASNTEKDFGHMEKIAKEWRAKNNSASDHFNLSDESDHYTQIAIQGPQAATILQKLTTTPLAPIKTYWFTEGTLLGDIPAILARTGYTGEDGFEVYVPWERGPQVWNALLEAGTPLGIKPCGLGARDTLRLEMKYPLYGSELTHHTHPLEAGLGWVTKFEKGDFVGRTPLEEHKNAGLKRKLIGFKMLDRGIPRHGYSILDAAGTKIGEVTSGTQSPSLNSAIGIGYVATEHSAIGTRLEINIRGQNVPAEIVQTPFIKK